MGEFKFKQIQIKLGMYRCIGIGSIGAFWGIGIGKKWPILYRYFSNIVP